MIKRTLAAMILASHSFALSEESAKPGPKVERENTEWCDIWIDSAASTDKPRVLLIGDSITMGYYKPVCEQMEGQAYCARFATSACVADPAFFKQLECVISQHHFDVIHFNNGLHGFGYTEQEYREGYERALKAIKTQFPSAKVIVALTTPLQSTSEKNSLNSRVDERNRIARDLAKTHGLEINDLHAITKDHPEFYRDPHHYKPEAIDLQARQVSEIIGKSLAGN